MIAGQRKLPDTMARWLLTLLLAASAVVLTPSASLADTTSDGTNDSYWNVGAPDNLDLPTDQPVYAVASDADLEALLNCLNALTPGSDNVDCSRSGAVGVCTDGWCTGYFSGYTTTFTLYTVEQNWAQWEAECKPLMEGRQPDGTNSFQAARDCSLRVGCEIHSDTTATTLSVFCPFAAGSPLGQLTLEDAIAPPSSGITSLPVLGPPEKVARDLAVSTGAALVLGVLALLPTQLINSTLSANSWILDRFRRKHRREVSGGSPGRGTARKVVSAIAAFVVASVAVGFVDPDFGTSWQSLSVVAMALGAFLLINLCATVLVWLIFRRRAAVDVPSIDVQFGYLVVIVATVLISRLLGLDPAIVFGAILAIETGRILTQNKSEALTLSGRLERATGFALMGLGFLAWLGYQTLALMGQEGATGVSIIQAFLSVLTIETIATLPILMLPLAFLPGSLIFAWSKWRWAVVYLLGLTLFIFVLVPLPDSWSETGQTLGSWSLIIVAYGVFAVAVWGLFAWLGARRKVPNEAGGTSPEAPPTDPETAQPEDRALGRNRNCDQATRNQ